MSPDSFAAALDVLCQNNMNFSVILELTAKLIRIPFCSTECSFCISWCSLESRCILLYSLESGCILWNLFVHSHTILLYSVLFLYFLVFLEISLYSFVLFEISLYSLESLCTFAHHSVLLSVPFVFPCIPWNLVVFLRIPWHLVVFLGISLYIRIPFCST